MESRTGIGIIGCGNISSAYFRLAPFFNNIKIVSCSDKNPKYSESKAIEFGIKSEPVSSLLNNNEVDIVINLTVPDSHFSVSKSILKSGKHLYSEKPFTLSLDEAIELEELANKNNLLIGGAPDTFLGGAHQQVRAILDDGELGRITSGTCYIMSHGMEHWHPNPGFFYKSGGGPVFDLGPYYISSLINLIGPVKQVLAFSSIPQKERIVLSEERFGEKITVETPTTIHSVMEFSNGAIITMISSWDVWSDEQKPMELYGTEGSIKVPDSNSFFGEIEILKKEGEFEKISSWDHPFSHPNQEQESGMIANYRSAGLSDLAFSIQKQITPRCNIELLTHTVEIMVSILRSSEKGQAISLKTTCERPEPLKPEDARLMLEK